MPFGRGFPNISASFTVDQEADPLGGGNYSVVIRGHLNGKTVAAKQSFDHGKSGTATCWAEMKILDYLRRRHGYFASPRNHTHIIAILGYAESPTALNADPYIVMEYHPYGSLKSYLQGSVLIDDLVRACGQSASAELLQSPEISNANTTTIVKNKASKVSGNPLGIRDNSCGSEDYFDLPEIQVQEKKNVKVSQLTQWAYEIASAMGFLSRNKVAHCDLALRNILLSSNNQAILSDFGLAKMLNGSGTCHLSAEEVEDRSSRRFPPEYFQNRIVGKHTEVWAFGIFLWELFTLGRIAYENLDENDIPSAVRNGERLSRPMNAPKQIYKLMSNCWDEVPALRPTFGEICRRLRDMMLLPTDREHNKYGTSGYISDQCLMVQCVNVMSCFI